MGLKDFPATIELPSSRSVDAIFARDFATVTNASPLARRGLGVARLIADGMSNKQIGARHFISEATVAVHGCALAR